MDVSWWLNWNLMSENEATSRLIPEGGGTASRGWRGTNSRAPHAQNTQRGSSPAPAWGVCHRGGLCWGRRPSTGNPRGAQPCPVSTALVWPYHSFTETLRTRAGKELLKAIGQKKATTKDTGTQTMTFTPLLSSFTTLPCNWY